MVLISGVYSALFYKKANQGSIILGLIGGVISNFILSIFF